MALVLFPYLRIVGEFGIPQTIVNLRDLTDDQLAQLNTISLLLSIGCFAIGAALAWPLALFFKTPQLAPVVIVTCIGLIPLGFRSVSEGLLSKEMRFRTLSLFEGLRALIAAASTLLLGIPRIRILGFGIGELNRYLRTDNLIRKRSPTAVRDAPANCTERATILWPAHPGIGVCSIGL